MADKKEGSSRKRTSTIAGVETSDARVRMFLGDRCINRESSEKIFELKERIESIKKLGAPELPKNKPKKPSKNASEADKKAYATEREAYDALKSKFDKFNSNEHVELDAAYIIMKRFMKIESFLASKKASEENGKELNKSSVNELTKLQAGYGSVYQHKNESADVYARREKAHNAIMKFIGTVNVADMAAVTAVCDKIKGKYPNISLLLEKDEWSRKALRINGQATIALATVIDEILSQLAKHTMINTLKMKDSIIQPDHCVSDGVEECSLFSLVSVLPHWIAIEDRQERREAWAAMKKSVDAEAAKNAQKVAKRKGEKYVRPESKVIKFEEQEVKDGHAFKIEENTTDKEGKPVVKKRYMWYDIDVSRENEEEEEEEENSDRGTDFAHFARNICKKVRAAAIDEGNYDFEKIRKSKPIAKFFSNLAIDFIFRIAAVVTELVALKGSSTITDDVIKSAVKILLLDSRAEMDGTNELYDDHKELLNLIESKVKTVSDYQTKTKNAAEQEANPEGAAEGGLDDEENDEAIEEAPKPVAPRRRRPAATPAARK
jgi:hypothetical protein